MSKKIDWGKTYKPVIGDCKRGVNSNSKYGNMKERWAKAIEEQEQMQKAQADYMEKKPTLDALLMVRIKEKTPIKILKSMSYTDEELRESTQGASFTSVQRNLSAGTELVFDHWDKIMNQLIFKSQDDNEYAIYNTEIDKLVFNSDIYKVVNEYFEKSKKE